jgi:hypothetical protein
VNPFLFMAWCVRIEITLSRPQTKDIDTYTGMYNIRGKEGGWMNRQVGTWQEGI